MALKLVTLVKKNLTLLVRHKSSGVIILLGPLLLIILMSLAFNTASPYSLVLGVFEEAPTPLTQSLLDSLKTQQMSIMQTENKESCIDNVKKGVFHVCAVFPENFDIDHGGTVTFFVDKSRHNLVYIITDVLQTKVQEKSEQLGEQLAGNVIDTLVKSGEELEDKQSLLKKIGGNSRSVVDTVDKLHTIMLHSNVSVSLIGFPFEQLEAEINELQGSSNITTAADQYLTSLKSRTEGLVQTVNSFDTVRVGALRDLVAIKALVDENADYASVVDSNLNTIVMNIRGVNMQSAGKIVSPLDTKIESVVQEKNRLNYLFPALIALIIMFVGLFLASSLEVRERNEQVAFKNLITPTSRWVFLLANFVTGMVVITMQLAVLFFAALFFFQEHLLQILLPLLAVLFLLAGVFVLFGMLIGTIFKSPETSMVGALSVGFILLFLSSTILPLEAMPTFLAQIVPYNPFYAGHFLLSKILLFQTSLADLTFSLLTLGGWFVGLLGFVFFAGSLRHDA